MQITIHIADDLRRRADHPKRLIEAVDQEQRTVRKMRQLAAHEPTEANLSHLGRELSRLADHHMLADEAEAALPLKDEAVEIWEKLGRPKAVFLAELDAAEITFELGRHDQALDQLHRLVTRSGDDPLAVYRDFALELRARCLARMGRTEQARADLKQALAIRNARGNARQIAHTERLLALVG